MNSVKRMATIEILRETDSYLLYFTDNQLIKIGVIKEVGLYGHPKDCFFKCHNNNNNPSSVGGEFHRLDGPHPWFRELSPLELLAMEAE